MWAWRGRRGPITPAARASRASSNNEAACILVLPRLGGGWASVAQAIAMYMKEAKQS